jgi:CubicO group peptidase (beta-lactamase class C family)
MNKSVWNKYVEKVSNTRLTNIIISQNGERLVEHHFDEEHRRNAYSATKSFTSAAVGLAVKEGLLSLDEYVSDCFPDEMPNHPSNYLKHLKVEHLLTMTIGQSGAYLMGGQRPFLEEDDWVHYSLAIPFAHEPGSVFQYSNVGPYLAGVLVSRRAGCTMADYLIPRLFEPLGIKRPTWEVDPLGNTFGAGGLFLTTSELLKFGELYLNQGVYNGKQILPKEWIEASKQAHFKKENSKNYYGYGYLFWMGPHGSYRADGKYGQIAMILEDKNVAVACNAESRDPKEFLEPFWEIIYPNL